MTSIGNNINTIAAIATSFGVGSISIIRVSGSNSLNLAKKITKKDNFTPRFATLCTLHDANDEFIDQALVIYFKSPFSFTGEDVVEFQCHGGSVVSTLVLQTLLDFGATLAQNGEFSKRAFLNNKMDLSKAEAISELINAKTKQSAKLLARHMRGELEEYVNNLRDELVQILAFVEVNIDYAEEDLPQDIFDMIHQKLLNITNSLHVSYENSKKRQGLLHGYHIAIVGKPNVGKSSLLNALLNDNRAIISDIAGTTRDSIEEELVLGTHLVKLIDTAGIRQTDDFVEQIGVQKAKDIIKQADIILALFDNSRKKDTEDLQLLEILNENQEDKKIFYILNKSDLANAFEYDDEFMKMSCKNSTTELIDLLVSYLDSQNISQGVLFTTSRQINAISNALQSIHASKELLNEGMLELFAFNINETLQYICQITKLYTNDEMLDSMFSNFCLGK